MSPIHLLSALLLLFGNYFLFTDSGKANQLDSFCSAGNVSLFELRLPFHYAKHTADNFALAHLISTVPLEREHQIPLNKSGDWHCTNALDGLVLDGPSLQCPSAECLLTLKAMAKWTETPPGIGRIRTIAEEPLCPDFFPLEGIPPILCAKESGFCGATIPLYSYYSERFKDQILTTAVSLNNLDYVREFGGNPICHIWTFPTVQIDLDQQLSCEYVDFAEKFAQTFFGISTAKDVVLQTTSPSNSEEKEENCTDGQSSTTTDEMSTTEAEATTATTTIEEMSEETYEVTTKMWRITRRKMDRRRPTGKPDPIVKIKEKIEIFIPTRAPFIPKRTTFPNDLYGQNGRRATNPTDRPAVIIISSDDEQRQRDFWSFVPRRWLHDWHWWILIGAISALLFCCCVISTLLCHLLCLQTAVAVCHRERAVHSSPPRVTYPVARRQSMPGTGQTYFIADKERQI